VTCVGSLDLAWLLVGHGTDVTAQDAHGQTPLHQVSEMGIVDLAQFLIEHGASVIVQDKYGTTGLHRASDSPSANTDVT